MNVDISIALKEEISQHPNHCNSRLQYAIKHSMDYHDEVQQYLLDIVCLKQLLLYFIVVIQLQYATIDKKTQGTYNHIHHYS